MTIAIQARETVYKGIPMRSRLEAHYAAGLDRMLKRDPGSSWIYEPKCFASDAGQYLPDFFVHSPAQHFYGYIEIKPEPILTDRPLLTAAIRRMEIIWASEPSVELMLQVGHSQPGSSRSEFPTQFWASGTTRVWRLKTHLIRIPLIVDFDQPAADTDSAKDDQG